LTNLFFGFTPFPADRALRCAVSLRFETPGRIYQGSPDSLEADGEQGDQQGAEACRYKDPPGDGGMIGIIMGLAFMGEKA
jgi:hypothetical protein